MLPFRRQERVVALDDTDIVEVHELALEDDIEMELDLGDAVEVRNAIQPHAYFQPNTRLFRLAEEPRVARPLTLADDDDEEEELTAVQPPSARHRSVSQITPSPFARTFMSHERTESLAPLAVSTYPEPTFMDSPSARADARLRFEHEERLESALEQRELDELTGSSSTRVLRGVALMLMGGVAAAALTAYVLRDEGGQSGPNAGRGVAASELAPPPSIVLPKDAILIGDTPPQQLETRLGARPMPAPPDRPPEPLREGETKPSPQPQPPTELKFGDGDTLLVTPPAPKASVVIASSGSNGSGSNGGGHTSPPKARKPSRPLAPNALLPDSDPPSYALPPSRGGAPKDPVAEAQLRASIR